MKTLTIIECWNLCETNSIFEFKCAAISYNHYDNTCYHYDIEFFGKENSGNDSEFTTLMRKSNLHKIIDIYKICAYLF